MATFRINLEENSRIKFFVCMMNYLALGCKMEYKHAAKRLEELACAKPGTLQAQERKELISLFVQFEKDIKKVNQMKGSNIFK